MDNFNALSVDNKAVAYALLNGRVIYSALPNYTNTTLALESTTLSASGLDSSLSGTYTLPDGVSYSYQGYNTPDAEFVKQGSGANNPFLIAPHVWCRAKHYNSTLSSFVDPSDNTKTLTVKEQIALSDWATANDLPLPSYDITDIEMIETNEAYAGSDDNIPYLMDFTQFQGMFQKDEIAGVAGYVVPQVYRKGQPVVFTSDSGTKLRWSTPHLLSNLIPEGEQYDTLRNAPATYLGTTGDSGRPVFLQIASKQVIVSHNWQIEKPTFSPTAPYYMTGPNYLAAFKLLKAYVESKGDTVKTVEI